MINIFENNSKYLSNLFVGLCSPVQSGVLWSKIQGTKQSYKRISAEEPQHQGRLSKFICNRHGSGHFLEEVKNSILALKT